MSRSVFIIGPGFIGGEILDLLVKEGYDVTALVRSESAAATLQKQTGAKTIIGELDDLTTIQDQVRVSDIVFHTATAHHLASVQAVFAGIHQRAQDNQQTIYIHTSGATHLADNSTGAFKSEVILDDIYPESIPLAKPAPRREVDHAFLQWREKIVYGVSQFEARMSIQIPALVRYALKYGVASYVGQGLSTWSQVHVRDLARGYVTIMHWMEQTTADEVLSNPYWFCENGDDLVWYDCAKAIGEALHAAGYLESPIPKTIPPETYGDIFGDATPLALGSNSRNKASRLRSLGWKPVEKSLFTTLREDELPVILKNAKPPAV